MHKNWIFLLVGKNHTFSGKFTCFLISISGITARFQGILEEGAVGDEAGMNISECCCLCVVLPSLGPRPPPPEDLPSAFYQGEILSRVALLSPKCEKMHAYERRVSGLLHGWEGMGQSLTSYCGFPGGISPFWHLTKVVRQFWEQTVFIQPLTKHLLRIHYGTGNTMQRCGKERMLRSFFP